MFRSVSPRFAHLVATANFAEARDGILCLPSLHLNLAATCSDDAARSATAFLRSRQRPSDLRHPPQRRSILVDCLSLLQINLQTTVEYGIWVSKMALDSFYHNKIEGLKLEIIKGQAVLRRLEAQRNDYNSRVRLLREELGLLQQPGSYVGEVVKVMGTKKVLVKVHPEGKYGM